MKIGLFANAYSDLPVAEVFKRAGSLSVDMIELASGGLSGTHHCDATKLIANDESFRSFAASIENSMVKISALTCHANPVHPDEDTAAKYDKALRDTVLLAEKLGVDKVVTFSGCPGSEGSVYPTWVTVVWPYDNLPLVKYQWEEKLIPYWMDFAKFAEDHNVRIAIEMYPGFSVYNPRSLLQLREACGKQIGATVDPGNLIWQGIDVAEAIKYLGDAVFHFHAKDCYVNKKVMDKVGAFDPDSGPFAEDSPYSFRIAGRGTNKTSWINMIDALRSVGYDDVLSIEHEDMTLGQDEGVIIAQRFLQSIKPNGSPAGCGWYRNVEEQEKAFVPHLEV